MRSGLRAASAERRQRYFTAIQSWRGVTEAARWWAPFGGIAVALTAVEDAETAISDPPKAVSLANRSRFWPSTFAPEPHASAKGIMWSMPSDGAFVKVRPSYAENQDPRRLGGRCFG